MKDYNNIVSLWVRGFTMEKENKADLCSVLVKLGLAVMSVAYPQTGSQASLASAVSMLCCLWLNRLAY